jgi:hypothetical protein
MDVQIVEAGRMPSSKQYWDKWGNVFDTDTAVIVASAVRGRSDYL